MINKEIRDIAREEISNIFSSTLKKYSGFTIQVIESIPSGDIKIYINNTQIWDVFRKSAKFTAFKKEMLKKYKNTVTSYSVLSYGLDNEEIIYQLERDKPEIPPVPFEKIQSDKEEKNRKRVEKNLRDKVFKKYGLKVGNVVEYLHYDAELDLYEARHDEITGFIDWSAGSIGVKFKSYFSQRSITDVRLYDTNNYELRHIAYIQNHDGTIKVGVSIALHDTENGLYNKSNTVQKVVHQLDKEDEIYILSHGELKHIENDKFHVSG